MTIVVAYADTAPGRAALTEALREAAPTGEEVILVPAVRHSPAPDPTELGAEFVTDLDSLTAAGGKVTVDHGDLADPSDSVVQIAQRRDARLVVVGLRHRTAVGKMLLGSTAQRILLDATCPVLAVKAPQGSHD
jgi:nucleotide-binding universal stress UspA family protein